MYKIRFFKYFATFTAFVFAAFIVNTGPAIAQEVKSDSTGEVIEEIVKMEALIERRLTGRPSDVGARIEVIELRRSVSFADLDLSKVKDLAEFNSRIENTAKESCEKLAKMFPIPVSGHSDIQRCIREAIASTQDKLETVIAKAG